MVNRICEDTAGYELWSTSPLRVRVRARVRIRARVRVRPRVRIGLGLGLKTSAKGHHDAYKQKIRLGIGWGPGCLNIENNPRWVISPPGPTLLC